MAYSAIHRCTVETDPAYKWYGARGIKVLFKDVEEFIDYLMTLPGHDKQELVIDRLDNSKYYEAGNLAFVSWKESGKNKRNGALTRYGYND